MTTPHLLIDTQDLVLHLTEADDGKTIRFRGEFGRVDKPTANGRFYSPTLMEREISRLMQSQSEGKLKVLGELDHPADGRTKLQRVSHVINSLKIEHPIVIGEATPLDTPNGRILSALAKAGVAIGVSSRGFGSTKVRGDGVEDVQEDFRLDTYDFVYQPADETAYPTMYAEEKELVRALEDGDMELSEEVLREQYPDLVKVIEEAAMVRARAGTLTEADRDRAVQTAVTESVAEAEKRTEARIRQRLTSSLLSEMEGVREVAIEQARSEAASDPRVAGAVSVCEQIASIIQPFGMAHDAQEALDVKDARIDELEAAVADRELEVQKAQREAKEAATLAKEAAFALHLERKLREVDTTRRNAIVNLVGSLADFATKDALDQRVEAVIAELDSSKPDPVDEDERSSFLKRLEALEDQMAETTARAERAEAEVKEANARTRKALDAADKVGVRAYAEGIAAGHPDGEKILSLTEDATSFDYIDKVVATIGVPPKADPEVARADSVTMESIRRRMASGKERDLHEEETGRKPKQNEDGKPTPSNSKGIFEEIGLPEAEFDRLAGTTPRQ